jgi:hypothetical protein
MPLPRLEATMADSDLLGTGKLELSLELTRYFLKAAARRRGSCSSARHHDDTVTGII